MYDPLRVVYLHSRLRKQEFGAFIKWANILLVFSLYIIYSEKQKDPELISGPLYVSVGAVKLRFTGILLMFDTELFKK